jgi:hypothetical protein
LHFVAFWHKADIHLSPGNVRYWGNSGHRGFTVSCLLLTQSGHGERPVGKANNDLGTVEHDRVTACYYDQP